ncbi:unnamed protein product [Victoria cruziana]
MEESDEEVMVEKEHPWEDRTLNLLQDSKIDQELSGGKNNPRVWKKHKLKWMKRPMGIPDVILEIQREDIRENALRCLSNFLLEKREEDPENYHRSGFLLFHSFGTMAILLQEVTGATMKMVNGNLGVRDARRLSNVLTLFQAVAANTETRFSFVRSHMPEFVIPLVLFESREDLIDNVRAISLSVIGILCQAREPEIIQWAIENNIVDVCDAAIRIGGELCKVLAMHILEAMLLDKNGISCICGYRSDDQLRRLVERLNISVDVLSVNQESSPRLLFHVIRCYVLLCTHARGFSAVVETLPVALMSNSFQEIMEVFPVIRKLYEQLLLSIGKGNDASPPIQRQPRESKINTRNGAASSSASTSEESPLLRPIDLNRTDWWPSPDDHYPFKLHSGKEN